MSTQIVLTETAKSDLRDIAVRLAERTKERNLAIRFVQELQSKTERLAQFPESGALPRDRVLKSSGYRFVVHKDYLLFYQYDTAQDKVYVLSVFHAKRDYMRVMKRFL